MDACIDPCCDADDEPFECPHCGGSGILLVCCDDICQGQGYCMHGDGEDIWALRNNVCNSS